MRYFFLLVIILSSLVAHTQSVMTDYPESFTIAVSNPLTVSRENVLVLVSAEQIRKNLKKFNPQAFVVMDGEKEIPSQYNHNDADNSGNSFCVGWLGRFRNAPAVDTIPSVRKQA